MTDHKAECLGSASFVVEAGDIDVYCAPSPVHEVGGNRFCAHTFPQSGNLTVSRIILTSTASVKALHIPLILS